MKNASNSLKPYLAVAALGGLALVYLALQSNPDAPKVQAPTDVAVQAKPVPAPEPAPKVVVKADPKKGTASGNYLAGHHAETIGDSNRALEFFQHASQDPRVATANLYSRMYILGLTQGELDAAFKSLDSAESLGGTGPLAKLARAIHFMKADKFDDVIAVFKKDERGIAKILTPAFTAWALIGKGETDAALLTLKKTAKNAKSHPMQVLHQALALDMSGDIEQAAARYQDLKKMAGLSLRSTQLMGSNLERQGLNQKALELYATSSSGAEAEILTAAAKARMDADTQPLLDVNTPQKGAAEALYGLSTVMLTQGSWETALALSNMALYLRPEFPAASMITAAAMEQNQRIEDANKVYEAIPQSSPLTWLARQHMAQNYDRLGQTDKAIATLRTMADNHPTRARPLITLGDIISGHKRYAEAAVIYTEALSRIATPKAEHWGVFYARGICYEQTKQWDKAEPDLLQALILQPNHPMILNYLGYSWIDQGLHLKKAVSMIRKAVDLRPRDGYIVDSLGWGLYRMGDFKSAVKSMERAIMLRPADPLINDHFGDALWRVGRIREARFQWQRSLDLDPKSDIADAVREKLKNGLEAPSVK